jgi:tripartite-type tricarboxylate transporter receptor subunit TctC
MKLPRRAFLHLAAGVAAIPFAPHVAKAQSYPSRPVRIIVGFAAGGTVDIVARVVGHWLSERLGQPFIVENRTGASGNIGTEAVVRAPADGYTLLGVAPANATNVALFDKLNFDFMRDITAVAGVIRVPNVMEVNPSFPAQTVAEFIAYAKANPTKVNFASAGSGTPQHLCAELFKVMTGVQMTHVPYRGNAPALTDLLGGQVHVMFDTMPNSVGHIKAGKLRPLAVTTARRWDGLPEIPTVGEFVPGYEASGWYGLAAPKSTPVEVIATLNNEVNAALANPQVKARLEELGGTVLPGSPADFGVLISDEIAKWGKIIKSANIRPD